MTWSASQYSRFEDERTRPVRDLVAAMPWRDARHVVDIGCGPGNSTEVLMARFPGAVVTGLDSSSDMVDAARKRLPDVNFEVADIARWADTDDSGTSGHAGPYDVILANAVLQWLPDHASLFPKLVRKLVPGGTLAVQMPDNLDEPAHRLMRQVAAEGPWAQRLASAVGARAPRASASWYYGLLQPHCARVDVWLTTYHHVLADGARGIVEWFKGSGLRPYLDALEAGERQEYLARYEGEIARAYPALADGSVLLPFPRLFIVATL